jgi:predicted nucleic acid-binding protein
MPTSGATEMNGMTEAPDNVVYLDANPFVYALEGTEDLAAILKELFSLFRQRPGSAVTSELTLAEVLPKRKLPDRHFLELLVWSGIFDLRPVSREILVDTAQYRRAVIASGAAGKRAMPKLPDAIHVVTAIQARSKVFLSSDIRIKLPDAMRFVRADKAGIAGLIREFA